MHPPTDRNLITSLSSQTDAIVSQRFSHTLLFNLLHYITILYLVMTVLSIPLWILSGIGFLNKIKQQQNVQIADILMFATLSYLKNPQPSPNCRQLTYQLANYTQSIIGEINNSCQNKEEVSYLTICLYYDIGLQLLVCLGYSVIQYYSFKTKQKHKGNHIEDYSLQITNIPLAHPYITLPKLEQHLVHQLNTHFELIASELHLFDAISIWAQQTYIENLLSSELETRMSQLVEFGNVGDRPERACNQRIKQIEGILRKMGHRHAQTDIVWVTFETRQARYLALRLLQSRDSIFLGNKLKVRKAPHPLQIEWENMHMAFIKMFLSRNISLVVCMTLLLLFDLLILFIHKSSYPLLASLVILVLEIILKQIIISVSSFEKHHHKSSLNLSIFCKLTKYLYINTALIMFISCFDFGGNPVLNTFSTATYHSINSSWFDGVGMNIMLSFCMQIGYVNLRPGIEVVKGWVRVWGKECWRKWSSKGKASQEGEIETDRVEQQRLKSELDICYTHIVSLVMFTNTYSFTHPIFYPLSSLFAFIAYRTHRRYITKHTQPAPYNNDYLNSASIQYLYASVIAHWILLAIGFSFMPALICAGVGATILFFKNTFLVLLSETARRKFGPFCFSKFQRSHASTTPLCSLLTPDQLNTHISNFENKIKMYTYLYNTKFENEDFISKGCLERAIKNLEQKIAKLQELREQKLWEVGQNKRMEVKESRIKKSPDQEIKGSISYKLSEEMLKE